MTMHLVQGMSTLNTKKRKTKLTDKRIKQLEVEWRQYNKRMRKANCHKAQFDAFEDYLNYVMGKTKLTKGEFTEHAKKNNAKPYVRNSQNGCSESSPSIQSGSSITRGEVPGFAAKPERKIYSGERRLLGIATMHKSNMVPIFEDNKEEAKEIASMRR